MFEFGAKLTLHDGYAQRGDRSLIIGGAECFTATNLISR